MLLFCEIANNYNICKQILDGWFDTCLCAYSKMTCPLKLLIYNKVSYLPIKTTSNLRKQSYNPQKLLTLKN